MSHKGQKMLNRIHDGKEVWVCPLHGLVASKETEKIIEFVYI